MSEAVDAKATAVVEAAIARRHVDGVRDLATALPMAIVPDLVGWPEDGRENLLPWAGATFDSLGPLNRQWLRTTPAAVSMLRFSRRVVRDRSVLAGSMGDDVLRAADDGALPRSECSGADDRLPGPVARHHDQRHQFGASTSSRPIPTSGRRCATIRRWCANAVNEVVRLESPLRAFSRKCRHRHRRRRRPDPPRVTRPGRLRLGQPRRARMGRPRHASTSPVTSTATWGSATAPTAAPDRDWPGWSPRRSCASSPPGWTASSSRAADLGASTTSSTATTGCPCELVPA